LGSQSRPVFSPARKIVLIALFTALGLIVSFVEIPIMPNLKYDPANIMALLCGFIVGPLWGVLAGALMALLHALVTGNWWGAVVNICVATAFVLPAALVYRHTQRTILQIVGLVLSCILLVVVAIVLNVAIYPLLGTPLNTVVAMIIPLLLPFNIIKGVLNAVLAFALIKALRLLVWQLG
jgi:riboflavin transporter FmnP